MKPQMNADESNPEAPISNHPRPRLSAINLAVALKTQPELREESKATLNRR
jgi:hypothetical protein